MPTTTTSTFTILRLQVEAVNDFSERFYRIYNTNMLHITGEAVSDFSKSLIEYTLYASGAIQNQESSFYNRIYSQVYERSSIYSPISRVRKFGSYVYEDFMPTDGQDVKVKHFG